MSSAVNDKLLFGKMNLCEAAIKFIGREYFYMISRFKWVKR